MTSKPTPPATPTTGAKPGMAMPLGASLSEPLELGEGDTVVLVASLNKDDREEKCRQIARLGAAMPRLVNQ